MRIVNTIVGSFIALSFTSTVAMADTYLRTKLDSTVRGNNRADSVLLQERIGYTNGTVWAEFGLGADLNGTDEGVASAEFGVTKELAKDLDVSVIFEPIYYMDSEDLDIEVEANLYLWL